MRTAGEVAHRLHNSLKEASANKARHIYGVIPANAGSIRRVFSFRQGSKSLLQQLTPAAMGRCFRAALHRTKAIRYIPSFRLTRLPILGGFSMTDQRPFNNTITAGAGLNDPITPVVKSPFSISRQSSNHDSVAPVSLDAYREMLARVMTRDEFKAAD